MLRVAGLKFRLRFGKSGNVSPWLGIVLRSAIGMVLRSLSCGRNQATCTSCPLALKCAYGYLFETPAPKELSPHKVSHAPHPFVFRPPLLEAVEAGLVVDLGLILVGRALEYYAYFIMAIQELGNRGLGHQRLPYELVGLECLRSGRILDPEFIPIQEIAFSIDPLKCGDIEMSNATRFRMILHTPLRLKIGNQRLFHFNFNAFIASLVRRVELLGWWHCNVDLYRRYSSFLQRAAEFAVISDETRFHDWVRFSRTQGQRMPVGGSLGSVTMKGPWDSFSGLFEAAAYLNVGSQTSFGLGQVEFIRLDEG